MRPSKSVQRFDASLACTVGGLQLLEDLDLQALISPTRGLVGRACRAADSVARAMRTGAICGGIRGALTIKLNLRGWLFAQTYGRSAGAALHPTISSPLTSSL